MEETESPRENLLTESLESDNNLESKEKNQDKENLNYYNKSFLNKILFFWTSKIMDLSNKEKLKISDINNLHENQSTRHNFYPLEETWKNFSSGKMTKYPLLFSIFRIHIFQLLQLFFIDFFYQILKLIRIYFFRQIILLFSSGNFYGKKIEKNSFFENIINLNIYQYGFFFILIKLIGSTLYHYTEFKDIIMQRKIKNEMTCLIFNKILKGNLYNFEGREEEKINLIENDCEKLGYIFYVFPKIINSPFVLFISLYFLFKLFGYEFFYSMLILFFFMTLVLFLQVFYFKNSKKIYKRKKERMNIVNDIFHMLKNIKINGWEEEFSKKIKNKRDEELKYVKRNLYINLIRILINSNLPLILLMISIGNFIHSNKILEISNLFTAFQLINQLKFPLMEIPIFINDFIINLSSIKKLEKYLFSNEHNYQKNENLEKKNIIIKYDKVTFGINILPENEKKIKFGRKKTNDSGRPSLIGSLNKEILLYDINLQIKKGEFIAIIGNKNSGKSNLINSFLNNYKVISSDYPIIINGKISYCPQESFIMEDTIKNNIIFYNKFDKEKYSKIITVCNIIKDLENFNNNDDIIINSSSKNLSFQQKKRISLARCLYKDCDIYLLDSPLYKNDSDISDNIFKNAFVNYLKGKTRILVTNDLNNLNYVDKVILMENKSIKFNGSYKEFINKFGKNFTLDNNDEKFDNLEKKKTKKFNENRLNLSNIYDQNSKFMISETQSEISIKTKDTKKEKNPLMLSDDKFKKKGKISFKTYISFLKLQGGYIMFLTLIIIMIIGRIINSYRSIYISKYAKNIKEIEDEKKREINILSQKNSFKIYFQISIIGILFNFLIEYFHCEITLFSQRVLHEKIVYKFLRAPINLFHDLVPIDQLLYRLTKDIDIIQKIIKVIVNFLKAIFTISASIIICYIYSKFTLLIFPILILITLKLSQYFINCSRNLQRLERITYTPIINILNESIKGVEIIRTSNTEENYREKLYKKLDDNFSVQIYLEGSKKWYAQRLRFFSHFFFGLIIIYILIRKEIFTPQSIALILHFSEEFYNELTNILNFFSNIEISLVSIERCESALNIIEEKKPNPNEEIYIKDNQWPPKGKIEFLNYSTKYKPFSPIILKKINLIINPNEKVGIIGKNLSGKSTLILSLCRIIESFDGKILIDETDISKINLDSLRQNITIIPTEPFILEGSLKENIDPLNKYKEKEILDILDSFNLFKEILNSKRRLNFQIKRNGNNLSLSEKQLISFARAALKKSKVIILDESINSMDEETEKIIEENINNLFEKSTILFVGNDLQMIDKCDRIIILDNGEIIEDDSLENIKENKKSKFYSLYNDMIQ